MATYKTKRDIESHCFQTTAGGRPIGSPWTLPAGSHVIRVKGVIGGHTDAFAAGNVAQLKELSGNHFDPTYRYMFIDADNVEIIS